MCIVLYFGIVYSVLFYSVIMLLHGFVLDYVTLYHVRLCYVDLYHTMLCSTIGRIGCAISL